jgi:hypothetical protein
VQQDAPEADRPGEALGQLGVEAPMTGQQAHGVGGSSRRPPPLRREEVVRDVEDRLTLLLGAVGHERPLLAKPLCSRVRRVGSTTSEDRRDQFPTTVHLVEVALAAVGLAGDPGRRVVVQQEPRAT